MIPNRANHIVKYNFNPEKVIELHLLKEPKTVNSFIVKFSHIEYFIRQERDSIKQIAIENDELLA